jgi:hypothetical protein
VRGYNFLSKFHFFNQCPLNIICVAALLLLTLYPVGVAYSAQVTLEWEASSDPDVAGYNIYQGTYSRDYDESMDVGNWTSATIAELEDNGTYYFAVTAYNSVGDESGYSNEVCLNCTTVDSTTPEVSSSSSGGGCFITTAAYGSRMALRIGPVATLMLIVLFTTLLVTGCAILFKRRIRGLREQDWALD